jgi:integrase
VSARLRDAILTRVLSTEGETIDQKSIYRSFRTAIKCAGLDGLGITPHALRRTRATIWESIDPDACRFALGHSAGDVHTRHYVKMTTERLLGLVGLEYKRLSLWEGGKKLG